MDNTSCQQALDIADFWPYIVSSWWQTALSIGAAFFSLFVVCTTVRKAYFHPNCKVRFQMSHTGLGPHRHDSSFMLLTSGTYDHY